MKSELQSQLEELSPIEKLAFENESEWQKMMDELVGIRIAKGFTQQQVGDSLGVSQAAVAQFEQHGTNPTIARIQLYAIAVGAALTFGAKDSGLDLPKVEVDGVSPRSSKPGPRATPLNLKR